MTAEGASSRARQWSARHWVALRDLPHHTPMRTKLLAALLALVIIALAAISISSFWLLRSYLTSQDDPQLQVAFGNIMANQNYPPTPEQVYHYRYSNILAGTQQPGAPLSPAGTQSGEPSYGGSSRMGSLPAVPTSQVWADLYNGKLLTVPAQSGTDTWRVITGPVSYLGTTSTGNPEQVTGTLVVAVDLGDINAVIGRLAEAELIVGTAIVCVLALAGVVVVRSNLRALVEIEETAEEIAAGHLNLRVPERDPRTEIGSLGRSLNIMLSQIETAFHAREQSEAAAHQSEERMRRFVADASHELRTPLTAIRGFAEYYRQRGGMAAHWDAGQPDAARRGPGSGTAGLSPADLDRIMQRVEKEAARMGLLVEDLLLLARLDQQRPLAQQPVDLLALAGDAVHDARMIAPDRNIDLSVQPGAAFLITGDEQRLRQVVGNLMSNALTHTPDGTPIEVSIGSGILDPRVSDSPRAATIDVTDHGPGMTPDQAHRVFERFYRADQARTSTTGGSGLGLAIVRALVAAHGGIASVRTDPGRGATFRIALPLAPEAQGGLPDDDEDADQLGPVDEAES
jgi:two-component system, OmpR family, sensor kinase